MVLLREGPRWHRQTHPRLRHLRIRRWQNPQEGRVSQSTRQPITPPAHWPDPVSGRTRSRAQPGLGETARQWVAGRLSAPRTAAVLTARPAPRQWSRAAITAARKLLPRFGCQDAGGCGMLRRNVALALA